MEAHHGGSHSGSASVPGVYHAGASDHRHVDLGDLSGPLELIGLLSFAFALASLRRRELSLAYLTHTLVSIILCAAPQLTIPSFAVKPQFKPRTTPSQFPPRILGPPAHAPAHTPAHTLTYTPTHTPTRTPTRTLAYQAMLCLIFVVGHFLEEHFLGQAKLMLFIGFGGGGEVP